MNIPTPRSNRDALYSDYSTPEEKITKLIDRVESAIANEDSPTIWGPIGEAWLKAHNAADSPNGAYTLELYREHLRLLDELLELLNEHHKELSNILQF